MKLSKRYKKSSEVVDSEKSYSLQEAVELLNQFEKAKFDETVELSIRLGADPKQGTQMVRGTLSLPNGSGKDVKVIVFTDNPQEALDAGAEEAGLDELIAKIKEGWTDFDVAISTTAAMKQVRTVARQLGPRGLMPNPKSGTVTDDVSAGIKEVKAGRVEFKMDKTSNMAVIVGKRSFTCEQLCENVQSAISAIGNARPDGISGRYITNMSVSSTMSPGVTLAPSIYSEF